MIYLLDSDSLIFVVRGLRVMPARIKTQLELRERAMRIVVRCKAAQATGDQVGVSVVTVSELEFGARRSRDYEGEIKAVDLVLRPFVVFDFTAPECSRAYGEVREAVEKAGRPMGAMDLLIAAHARALEATLVTNNLNDFAHVPDLRCENWSQP